MDSSGLPGRKVGRGNGHHSSPEMVGRGCAPADLGLRPIALPITRLLMSHIPERWDGLDFWYFVTVVTHRRQPVFAGESACTILQKAFHEAYHHYPFRLAALVILPDHWHALIRPGNPKPAVAKSQPPTGAQPEAEERARSTRVVIEQVVGAVKRNVLRDLQVKCPSIWQTRFLDHRIRNEEDFVITPRGSRRLGKAKPKTTAEVEAVLAAARK